MVQPQRASTVSSVGGLMQRGLSSTLSGMQPHSQPQRVKHGTNSNSSNSNTTFVLRIAIISCFSILLVYVIFYLSIFHALFHDAKQQPPPLLIRQMKNSMKNSIPSKDNLQIAVNAANKIISHQSKERQGSEGEAPLKTKETLVLTTKMGQIKIVLRPDLSPESVSYVRQMAITPDACGRCNIYRGEKPGILQGIIASPTISIQGIPKGPCPVGYENVSNECPAWDTNCNCHGPIMTKGMVGWAAGATGPDFFMDTYEREAKWWGTQHTVFGEIQDANSFRVIHDIYNTLPTHEVGGLTLLDEPLHFTLSLI